jgi:hypothetical protein
MDAKEIVEFVKRNIEPLAAFGLYGGGYRVSVTLSDGTLLPCVLVSGANSRTDLAIKRFKETATYTDLHIGYREIVKTFVCGGNTINHHDIRELSACPFAIPVARMKEIGAETSMAWTEFSAFMNDGAEFRFGTTFIREFFNMPAGYTASDIKRIESASGGESRERELFRERPFFMCYLDRL